MDVDYLITSVFQRSALWDRSEKQYKNRSTCDKLWKEISREMNEDEGVLKKKWKYLRDQFSAELKKLSPARPGDPLSEQPTSKWRYFQQLSFLEDTFKHRRPSGNLPCTQKPSNDTQSKPLTPSPVSHEEEPYLEEVSSEDGTNTSEKTFSCMHPNKRLKTTDSFDTTNLEFEKLRLEYLKAKSQIEQEDDEHVLFFKSILSHVRRIPSSQILEFRCRVQELVAQYLRQDVSYCAGPSFSAIAKRSPPDRSNGTAQDYS